MKMTVAELVTKLELTYDGDGNKLITHACGLDGKNPDGISYVENKRFIKHALASPIEVLVCHETTELPGKIRLFAPYPDMMIIKITNLLHPPKVYLPEIHSSLITGKNCQLGEGLSIDANVVIGNRVKIGSGTVLMAGTVIGDDCQIGRDCMFHPNVTIRDDSIIENRVVINSGVVIGAEGYGFVTHKGKHYKIPQIGYAHVEDDVEIGACNTVDRGRFGVTRIGKGTKTDNIVHVGHNVEIGDDSLVVGMVGFAGSTKTGHHLTIAGQSMISGHLKIGNNVTVSAKSLLAKSVGDGGQYTGIPARPHKDWLKANGYLYRLRTVFDFLKSFKTPKQ